jgi:hypothetical protein
MCYLIKKDINSLCCVVMKYLHYSDIQDINIQQSSSQVTGGFTAINQFKNDDANDIFYL